MNNLKVFHLLHLLREPMPFLTLNKSAVIHIEDHLKKFSKFIVKKGLGLRHYFYSKALQCEYDISHTIYKFQCKLKNDVDTSGSMAPNVVFGLLQTMTKHFRSWKTKVDELAEQGSVLPQLNLDEEHLTSINTLTAVCSMDTNEDTENGTTCIA
ncbi:hypothetical protein HELRODRAFT_184271 [Helobdella robusta]|uniref:Uncharacterized protein n=1 Tax=Helobdella robusta TaxID=6412 RepID=T1FKW2_HELRO|nr:hypothetical protein HELRODRAFT_184271 [Helobdella robusta]ESO03514.1 hypothetical protein HELRODRAFT_184271 [Helobdella robusta]